MQLKLLFESVPPGVLFDTNIDTLGEHIIPGQACEHPRRWLP